MNSINCLKLNINMLGHVVMNRWLSKEDFATSYDSLAEKYDESPLTVVTTIIMTTAASLVTIPVALKFLG